MVPRSIYYHRNVRSEYGFRNIFGYENFKYYSWSYKIYVNSFKSKIIESCSLNFKLLIEFQRTKDKRTTKNLFFSSKLLNFYGHLP